MVFSSGSNKSLIYGTVLWKYQNGSNWEDNALVNSEYCIVCCFVLEDHL